MIRDSLLPVYPTYSFTDKVKDYLLLTKFRLSALVVFSSLVGAVIASGSEIDFGLLAWLAIGGSLVTGASNTFNQVMERKLDALMERTKQRPLPASRMNNSEALFAGIVMAIAGIVILWYFLNPLCGALSLISLLLYTLAYTPSKRYTPVSVFIGAIPGAFPPLLGYVSVSNQVNLEAMLLFSIQFIWQFPHFWAIAWVMHDDYLKAGFRMLPSGSGRSRISAFQIMAYCLALIPLSMLPFIFDFVSILSTVLFVIVSIWFSLPSIHLFKKLDLPSSRKLMYASFAYLPLVQLIWMIDRLLS